MTGLNAARMDMAELHHRTLAGAPDAILWVDAGGWIRYANATACRRLGFSHAELTARSIYDLDAGGLRREGRTLHDVLLANLDRPFETLFQTKAGEWLPVEINSSTIELGNHRLLCLFARDISACRHSERTSRQSEERLRAIGQALPDLVFVIDEEGRHLEVLTARENLLYAPADHIVNRRLHDLFEKPLADRFLSLIRQTIRGRAAGLIEYELPIGEKICSFEARTAPLDLPIDGKRCCVWIARDISERKRTEELANHNTYLQEQLQRELNYGDIIGVSAPMKQLFRHIDKVSATDATVLLMGETGTGKELIARAIHHLSRRKERVLIKVDCGALPAGLMESELFGHEKGAFTGAAAQKKGRFELAHKGTLFLDEVGELPPETQSKLLRVLQEQEFERVGGEHTIKVDVRIIAATNRDLERDVRSGRFRADLYYRLNIFPMTIPPLRERKDDIPLLAQYFVRKFCERMGKQIKSIHAAGLDKLTECRWPGNVRELANILERAVILCDGEVLTPMHISGLSDPAAVDGDFPSLEEMERRHILEALSRSNGTLAGPKGAAALLDINRSTLWSRMQKLGISGSRHFS